MYYERRLGRAEACVHESAHHALANAGGREIVGKKEGEQKGSARGSVHWGCYYATALDIEVDPQRCCLGRRQSDFAVQAVGLQGLPQGRINEFGILQLPKNVAECGGVGATALCGLNNPISELQAGGGPLRCAPSGVAAPCVPPRLLPAAKPSGAHQHTHPATSHPGGSAACAAPCPRASERSPVKFGRRCA